MSAEVVRVPNPEPKPTPREKQDGCAAIRRRLQRANAQLAASEAAVATLRQALQQLQQTQGTIVPVLNYEVLSADWVHQIVDRALAATPEPRT